MITDFNRQWKNQPFICSLIYFDDSKIWHKGENFPSDFDYKGLVFVRPYPPFLNVTGTWIDEKDDYVGLKHPTPVLYHITEGEEKVTFLCLIKNIIL